MKGLDAFLGQPTPCLARRMSKPFSCTLGLKQPPDDLGASKIGCRLTGEEIPFG
jgi:hypothetical protein